MRRLTFACALMLAGFAGAGARAAVMTYGDVDIVNQAAPGAFDPRDGAVLEGLAPGQLSAGTYAYGHGYPFSPSPGDYPGTDQIYVGANQTASHDGYSASPQRIAGPQVITIDYSALLSPNHPVTTFTLGLAMDDFQAPLWGNPFTGSVNGKPYDPLSALLNSVTQTGPIERFHSIGIDTSLLDPSGILTLTIDEGGDGGDGWALDFVTAGVTVPEPATMPVLLAGLFGLGMLRRTARSR